MTVAGATSGSSALQSATCGGGGPEFVYSFTQAVAGRFLATVAASVTSGNLKPVIYLRSACTTGPDVACTPAVAGVLHRSLDIPSLDAGMYELVVDGSAPPPSAGPYTLTAFQGTPPGDSCSTSPRIVDLSAATQVRFAGDTTGMGRDFLQTCAGTQGADIVYQLTAPRNGTLTVNTRGTFDVNLGLTSGGTMCSNSPEVTCADNDTGGDHSNETVIVTIATGTVYWFWVAGYDNGEEGPYQISFSLP